MLYNNVYVAQYVESFMPKVYAWMVAGLLTTVSVASFLMFHIDLLVMIFSFSYAMTALFIAQIALIIYLGSSVLSMSYARAVTLFLVYAALMGISLAPVAIVYEIESIVQLLAITAGMFGTMALYGFFTRTDLTRFSNMLFMALWGLIIVSGVNYFFASSRLDFGISLFGVLLFTALTAYDVQKIKLMGDVLYDIESPEEVPALSNKLALYGAVTLYLDFVNLFLRLLQLGGKKRK